MVVGSTNSSVKRIDENGKPKTTGRQIDCYIGAENIAKDFKSHMDNWISRFHEAKPIDENQKVLVPGDPEREMEVIRMKEGIPVVDSVVEDLKKVGEQFGIEL